MTRPNPNIYREGITGTQVDNLSTTNSVPWWKRSSDVVGASVGLLILSPLMVIVACYIKLTSRGPVLFRHRRYGHKGNPIYVWKFRTLHVNADPTDHQEHVLNIARGNAELTKINHDAQLIPLGKWLRCTAIDELPQLFNVLKGEMSLVGPRPDVVPVEQYTEWQRRRFEVLPGLTGLWQVGGKNQTTFNEMNQLDVTYVEECSPLLDLKIIVLTIPAIFKLVAEDAVAKNKSPLKTTEEFEKDQHDSTA